MHVEFEKLEQRPGAHTVPVRMTREELEAVAEKMASVNVRIQAKKDDLRDYTREINEEVKTLEEERKAITSTYRFKREPKPVEGLFGFDFNDHGRVACKKCIERGEKRAKDDKLDPYEPERFDTPEALLAWHDAIEEKTVPEEPDVYPNQVGEKHPAMPVWERPLGTKWFVDPKSGEVYGPLRATEKDMTRELFPATKDFQPFQLTFDSETAVPLLDAAQVSAAEKKLKETEEATPERHAIAEEVHEECGLPLAWHPTQNEPVTCGHCTFEESDGSLIEQCADCTEKEAKFDACKEAMIVGANQANEEQARRTQEKYGNDVVLDPDATYPCGNCNVETFGRDLQPVTIDGVEKQVCFACEQNVPRGDQPPEKKEKKKGARKKKKGGEATA